MCFFFIYFFTPFISFFLFKGKLGEPKEIGSGGIIYGNPHLIKPIPLKPAQDAHIQGQTQQVQSLSMFMTQFVLSVNG